MFNIWHAILQLYLIYSFTMYINSIGQTAFVVVVKHGFQIYKLCKFCILKSQVCLDSFILLSCLSWWTIMCDFCSVHSVLFLCLSIQSLFFKGMQKPSMYKGCHYCMQRLFTPKKTSFGGLTSDKLKHFNFFLPQYTISFYSRACQSLLYRKCLISSVYIKLFTQKHGSCTGLTN